jgi:signal peptidase II
MRRETIPGKKKGIEPGEKNCFCGIITRYCPFLFHNVTFFFLAALVFAADQLSKFWITRRLLLGESWPLLPNIFHLTYLLNPGAAFGILAHRTVFFVAISFLIILLIIVGGFLIPSQHYLLRLALSLQLGGALGNLCDRLRFGYVVDFLDFRIWPVFNLADIAIVLGTGLLLLSLIDKESLPDL